MSFGTVLGATAVAAGGYLFAKTTLNQPSRTGNGTKGDHLKRTVRSHVKPVHRNIDAGIRVVSNSARKAVDGLESVSAMAGVSVARNAPRFADAAKRGVTVVEGKATEFSAAAAKKVKKATKKAD